MIANPTYFQVRIANSVQSTSPVSASQSCRRSPSPTAAMRASNGPLGCRMSRQASPTTTSLSTYGMKMSTRNSRRPGSLRLSSSATPIAIGPWISSDRPTMKKLWPMALTNTGSESARA